MEEDKLLGMLRSAEIEMNVLAATVILAKGMEYAENYFMEHGTRRDVYVGINNPDEVYKYRIPRGTNNGADIICVSYKEVGYMIFSQSVTLRKRINSTLLALLIAHKKFIEI